jgi:hypothetical protein
MKCIRIQPLNNPLKNQGDAREWALAAALGVERGRHDSKDYRHAADIEVGTRRISVKSGALSLMSARFCEGETTLEGIVDVYERTTYANEHAYITEDYRVFLMNAMEFRAFLLMFGRVGRESTKNGGGLKVKMSHETKKRVAWLEAQCAA